MKTFFAVIFLLTLVSCSKYDDGFTQPFNSMKQIQRQHDSLAIVAAMQQVGNLMSDSIPATKPH